MKKRVIIGDMHGRYELVEHIYNKENPDEVIMLGDYVDSHEVGHKNIKHSVEKLIELKNNHDINKGQFILLFGNHDYHYLVNDRNERYSGWNSTTNYWAHPLFNDWLRSRYAQFSYIDYQNKTIYTHAGVSNTWLNDTCIRAISHPNPATIDEINDMSIYNFGFDYINSYDPYGNTRWNGPLWIRPQALFSDMYKDSEGYIWKQIVGHTQVKEAFWVPSEDNNDLNEKLLLLDCIDKNYLVELLDNNNNIIYREIMLTK